MRWIPLVLVPALSACGGNVQVLTQGSAGGAGGVTSASSAGGAGGAPSASTANSTSSSAAVSTGAGAGGSGGAGAGGSGGATGCGGSSGCAADEWCDFPKDDCGAAGAMGTCRKRPASCPSPPPAPICACDGHDYRGACLAEQAGFDVRGKTACDGVLTFPCGPAQFCKRDVEYCDVDNGIAAVYQCLPLPGSCQPSQVAVCGCMPTAPDCGSCSGTIGQITESHGCG
jgi:hypothetical protein